MGYKTTDGLMRHLRANGINISGSTQKRQLINSGYYHGYKGYRYFNDSQTRLPFTSFKEIYATIQYDSALKALLYSKMMYIETAMKNIALDSILVKANSERIQDMFDKVISSYKNAPSNLNDDQKRKLQQKKLDLQKKIHSEISREYSKGNRKITHFYNNTNQNDVPLWALFEILNMGDFGNLLSCLSYDVRDYISKKLGINLSCDTNRQLIFTYIFLLKDLRNAIAHNAVIFDTRFRTMKPSNAMTQCLKLEIGLPYVNFKTIGDYFILMCYYLKLLHLPKNEIKAFIREFEKITTEYLNSVGKNVSSIVIHPDLQSRLTALKKFI